MRTAEDVQSATAVVGHPTGVSEVSRRTIFIISGLLALATLLAGLAGVTGRNSGFQAEARVLIAPTAGSTDRSVQASDTLSRGTVVATFAEALQDKSVVSAAYDAADPGTLSRDAAAGAMVSTRVLAGTSIILILVKSADPLQAEKVADAVAAYEPDLGGYTEGFQRTVLGSAEGTAERYGPSFAVLVAIAIGAAIAAFVISAALLRRVPAWVYAAPERDEASSPAPDLPDDSASSTRRETARTAPPR